LHHQKNQKLKTKQYQSKKNKKSNDPHSNTKQSESESLINQSSTSTSAQTNISDLIFMNKTKRKKAEENRQKEFDSLPKPPPKGWEMLLHRPSGKMYYASLYTNEVRWTLPPPIKMNPKKQE